MMVFLHIQKTGGTSFGRHLVHDLDLKVCEDKCFPICFFFSALKIYIFVRDLLWLIALKNG